MNRLRDVALVDDNEADLEYTRIVLERSGLVDTLHSFESAPEALTWLEGRVGRGVDGVLLDINMPGMDGFGFLAALQQHRLGPALPAVVMLTSSAAEEDRARAAAFACVRGFFTKPLHRTQVAELVRLLLPRG